MHTVQRVGGRKRARELWVQRATSRQRDELGETAKARLAAAKDGWRCAAAHGRERLRKAADAADTGSMRTLSLILGLLVLFSGWQYLRKHQNEQRLALVASELAQREVGVGCPGFWMRLVEITPHAGWVAFDENGRPADETKLSATTCRSLERLWRADAPPSFACLRSGSCQDSTARARGRDRHPGTRVVAPARNRRRGADAVLRRADDRARGRSLRDRLRGQQADRALGGRRQRRPRAARVRDVGPANEEVPPFATGLRGDVVRPPLARCRIADARRSGGASIGEQVADAC